MTSTDDARPALTRGVYFIRGCVEVQKHQERIIMNNAGLVGKLVYRVQIANPASADKRIYGIEEFSVHCVYPDGKVVLRRVGDDRPYFVNEELTTDGSLTGFDTTVTLAVKRMDDIVLKCDRGC